MYKGLLLELIKNRLRNNGNPIFLTTRKNSKDNRIIFNLFSDIVDTTDTYMRIYKNDITTYITKNKENFLNKDKKEILNKILTHYEEQALNSNTADIILWNFIQIDMKNNWLDFIDTEKLNELNNIELQKIRKMKLNKLNEII